MTKPEIFLVFFISLLIPFSGNAEQSGKLPLCVLLISGNNNHEWQKTSPLFKQILEDSGYFKVDITEKPDTLKVVDLKNYSDIASNWNAFPASNRQWGEVAEKAIMSFINSGGGFVLFHAASAANYDWPEFQEMLGATWGKNTHHGKIAPFEVKISDHQHPITKGMADFTITDELWVDLEQKSGNQILCTAFATASNKGNDREEPVAICRHQGKGRVFYLVLGHDEAAMQNLGWKTLMLRGAQWAATGKVSIPIPEKLSSVNPAKKLSWKKQTNSLALMDNQTVVWQLNYNKDEGKPYFHPLSTPNGTIITGLRPNDHPWHRGVWFSWKFINGLNYWEEDRVTGQSEGITELKSVKVKTTKDFRAEFHMQLSYHPQNETDLLIEDRLVKISPLLPDSSYFINWESNFTAMEDDVELDRTPLPQEPDGKSWGGYAGFSARLNNQLNDVIAINDAGETADLNGKPSRWMTFGMKEDKSKKVSITIFDHPENRNYPNKWYISLDNKTPFYYFSPAILYNSKMILKKGEKLKLKYLLLVSSGKQSHIQLQSDWENFIKNKSF